MSTCVPCKEEGRGQVVAHYEADVRRNRPAMCFAHYWKSKGEEPKGVVKPPVAGTVVEVVAVPVCSEKGCVFPATETGKCRQHNVVETQHRGIYADSREWRESGSSEVKKPEVEKVIYSGPPAKFEVFEKPKSAGKDNRVGRLKACDFRTPDHSEYAKMPGYCLHPQDLLKIAVRRLLEGDTNYEIAAATGISKNTLYRIQKWLEKPAAGEDQPTSDEVEYVQDQEEIEKRERLAEIKPRRLQEETVTMTHQKQTVTETVQVEQTRSEIVVAPPAKEGLPVLIDTNIDLLDGKLATAMATIKLASGGDVFIMSNVNVFSVNEEDREFLFELIDLCRGYVARHPEIQKVSE